MASALAEPLLPAGSTPAAPPSSALFRAYCFVEGKTPLGKKYQTLTVILILANLAALIVGSAFLEAYDPDGLSRLCAGDGCRRLDALFFGNYDDNGLLGTSVLEVVTVAVFSADYLLRLAAAPYEDAEYAGFSGRLRFLVSFYSVVDLLSTLPFYIDFFVPGNLPASQAIRMFRLVRMLRLEGKYVESFTLLDDLVLELRGAGVMSTAGFIGVTIWFICSAFYYLAERRNPQMIYCPACDDVDPEDCTIDSWGIVDCTDAGCPSTPLDPTPCYNLFESIPSSLFFCLLNLFGEFPLAGQHSAWGKVLATFVALFAVAFFAIPASIIGNAFETVLAQRKARLEAADTRRRDDSTLGVMMRHVRDSGYMLSAAGVGALLVWLAFSTALYFAERDSLDAEMAANYKTIPDAMWITLLNLSGESPLCHYSLPGRVMAGLIGLVATGLFGIPIGLIGATFESVVEEETADRPDECRDAPPAAAPPPAALAALHAALQRTQLPIFFLIFLTVLLAILETDPAFACEAESAATPMCAAFAAAEWVAVVAFTLEYLLRLVAAPADPDLQSAWSPRLAFIFSFYSLIDVLAIAPFYVATALPGGWVDQHDGYFRMLRLLRLLKLDEYIPSITLIDDVFRLKRQPLAIAGAAAAALWAIFSALLYLSEADDTSNALDPLPAYGCAANCSMADRFSSLPSAAFYTLIHLTGDYPIITYSAWGRVVCFVMVVAAVGIVSIPSGLIASGFSEVVEGHASTRSGDGYFEREYKKLEGVAPPPSRCGALADKLQLRALAFLNGTPDGGGGVRRSAASALFRNVVLFLILTNLLAVAAETVPQLDRAVGNEPFNFFDTFEALSVAVFSFEYLLRIFSISKDREHLYSRMFYATTFFGIIDVASFLPWYIQQIGIALGLFGHDKSDAAAIFRIFRLFRILQLERFMVAFTLLDNVFRASADVLKATGVMALIIWVGGTALFYLFEVNNPNYRTCDEEVPLEECFAFASTAECNEAYPGSCSQDSFTTMPETLYLTAIFLCGEWAIVDFTWGGRIVAVFMCAAGIAIAAIPIGTLFESFGAVVGIDGDGDEQADAGDEKEG